MASASTGQLCRSAEDLYAILQKCECALDSVALKLEHEFSERYSSLGLNPFTMSKRIKQLSTQIPALKTDCQALIQRKQALIDAAQQQLLANRDLLLDMTGKLGICQDEEPSTVDDFNDALAQWDQVAAQQCQEIADRPSYMSRDELNHALAGSMLGLQQ